MATVEAPPTKRCTKCSEDKPLSEFYRSNTRKAGYMSRCKPCSYTPRPRNPRLNEEGLRFCPRCGEYKDPTLYYATASYCPPCDRDRKYGLQPNEYAELLFLQGGVCAICGEDSDKKLVVDHDHDSGQVRGLLCGRCNHGLGMLGDNVEGVRRALDYLTKGCE
jgi:hypothetical protein